MCDNYIKVIKNSFELFQIPIDLDDTILISKLMAKIPGAINLKYYIGSYPHDEEDDFSWINDNENASWKTLRILDNRLQPPVDGWDSHAYYYCITKIDSTQNDYINFESLSLTTNWDLCEELATKALCTIYEKDGFCQKQLDNSCPLIHGDYCDVCRKFSIHPFSEKLRENHLKSCIEKQEILYETQSQTCAICLEMFGDFDQSTLLLTKSKTIKKIAFMENCNHFYCLDCIEKWRNDRKEDNVCYLDKSERKRCPQCRIISNVIVSSDHFIDEKEKKEKIIEQNQNF